MTSETKKKKIVVIVCIFISFCLECKKNKKKLWDNFFF